MVCGIMPGTFTLNRLFNIMLTGFITLVASLLWSFEIPSVICLKMLSLHVSPRYSARFYTPDL